MPAIRERRRGHRPSKDDPTYEDRIQEALRGVLSGKYLNYQQAADDLNVAPNTLRDRARRSHRSWKESSEARQSLSPDQEQTLLDWCAQRSEEGRPFNGTTLRQQATSIAGHKLGRKWLRLFEARHPEITAARPQKLDEKRAKNFNRTNVGDFFDKYETVHEEYGGIPPEHIWNMDEKGIQMGGGRKNDGQKSYYMRAQKNRYKISSDNLELATVIECVSAAGNSIPPSFVLTNGRLPDLRGLPRDSWASIYRSDSGWTDNENGAEWLEQVFIPNAQGFMVDKEKPILLIMDGHESHESLNLKRVVYRHLRDSENPVEVIILCFPSKCTHKMQPLDVGVFSVVGRQWRKHCDERAIMKKINRFSIIPEYIQGVRHTITKELIQSSFRSTGIWPINRNIFTDEDFAPSNASSLTLHVPESYPPDVRPSSPACATDNNEDSNTDTSDDEYMNSDCDSDMIKTETESDTMPPTPAGSEPRKSTSSGLIDCLEAISQSQSRRVTRSASAEQNAVIKPPVFVSLERDQRLTTEERLDEIRSLRMQLHCTYQAMESYQAQIGASNSHCTMAKNEAEEGRVQLENEIRKHSRGSTKIKARFLTKKSLEDDFDREDAENQERERVNAVKEAQKKSDSAAREERIVQNAALKTFGEPLASLKRKEDLETLARALRISSTGTIKEFQDRIKDHLTAHPELRQNPRFQGLFQTQETRRRHHQATATVERNNQVPPTIQPVPEKTSESPNPASLTSEPHLQAGPSTHRDTGMPNTYYPQAHFHYPYYQHYQQHTFPNTTNFNQ